MHVKTYTGNNTREVLDAIKAEFGADAVILGSREVQKDGKRLFEITAGTERSSSNTSTSAAPPGGAPPTGWDEWHKEWGQLKDHIYTLMQPAIQWNKLSPHQRVALEYLQKEGVGNDVIMEFYKLLTADNHQEQMHQRGSMLAVLASLVPVKSYTIKNYPQRVHIMAGPYGSGKTSAALRLAMLRKEESPSQQIAFINADSSRGNGRLVLRHWADLSGFPYYEAPDAAAMQAALNACREKSTIFIDTQAIGRNQLFQDTITNLGLDKLQANVYLTLSPHYSNIKELLKRYKNHFPTSLLWTKIDEADHYAELVNVAVRHKLPICALSYGAELQGTLTSANERQIWRLILKHQLPDTI